eukprot:g11911.t1
MVGAMKLCFGKAAPAACGVVGFCKACVSLVVSRFPLFVSLSYEAQTSADKAALEAKLEVVQQLVREGDANQVDPQGRTPLYLAFSGHLETSADKAALEAKLEVVQQLVREGDANQVDPQGRTPLYLAFSGHLEVVQLLVIASSEVLGYPQKQENRHRKKVQKH